MKVLCTLAAIVLVVMSALMALKGLIGFVATLGTVQGSEFGLQITLVNNLSFLMMWAASLAVWLVLKHASQSSS